MDSIQKTLESMETDRNLNERLNKLRQSVFTDPDIRSFFHAHPNIDKESIDKSLSKLYEFKKNMDHCRNCPGLSSCSNVLKGHKPELFMDRGSIELQYRPCSLKKRAEDEAKRSSLIKSMYIPKEILLAHFSDIDEDHERRIEAKEQALYFALRARPGEDGEGLYFYGKFGVGKTFMMGAIANELAKQGHRTLLVYAPDFFREMKQAISDGNLQEKIDAVKKVDVLILDDIGAETMSSWIRDDVLGVILQYRMMEKLPTLYTSNYDYDELEEHLSYSQKSGIEQLKAKRIMERIRHYTKPVYLDGKNRREQS